MNTNTSSNVEQQKIQRILKLIRLLLEHKYTVKRLSELLEISDKTIYKDLKLLEELDYLVEKDLNNKYFLFLPSIHKELLNEEEKIFLLEILSAVQDRIESQTITQKLKIDHLIPSPQYLSGIQKVDFVSIIQVAIENKQWIVLKKYRSSLSANAKDRLVLPLKILNNAQIAAYEKETGQLKHFKIHRILKVEISDLQYPLPQGIELKENDLFGMSGKTDTIVKLLLSEQAKNLLFEEYPQAVDLTETTTNLKYPHQLTIPVKSFDGIGRFILGLPGEVNVVMPSELTEYLLNRMRKNTFLAS